MTLIVNTDGGARGNPGPAAIGVLIATGNGRILAKLGRKIGSATNNTAEYRAVIAALEWIKNNAKDEVEKINFFLDSVLVVNQLNGIFKIKESHLRDLIIQIRILEGEINAGISYQYIPREKNKSADLLVNQALDNSLI